MRPRGRDPSGRVDSTSVLACRTADRDPADIEAGVQPEVIGATVGHRIPPAPPDVLAPAGPPPPPARRGPTSNWLPVRGCTRPASLGDRGNLKTTSSADDQTATGIHPESATRPAIATVFLALVCGGTPPRRMLRPPPAENPIRAESLSELRGLPDSPGPHRVPSRRSVARVQATGRESIRFIPRPPRPSVGGGGGGRTPARGLTGLGGHPFKARSTVRDRDARSPTAIATRPAGRPGRPALSTPPGGLLHDRPAGAPRRSRAPPRAPCVGGGGGGGQAPPTPPRPASRKRATGGGGATRSGSFAGCGFRSLRNEVRPATSRCAPSALPVRPQATAVPTSTQTSAM